MSGYTLIYPDYIDRATGKTLVVIPGSAYTAVIASGRNAAMSSYPNDGRWTDASTFLGLAAGEPEPAAGEPEPAPKNIEKKAAAEPGGSTVKDKNKGGA